MSKQLDLANLSDESILRYSDDSVKSFGDWVAEHEEETLVNSLRLQSLKSLDEGLPSMRVVLKDIQARFASMETAMPSKNECHTKEERPEHLE